MLSIKESVFAKTRTSTKGNGGTYDSGFTKLSDLKAMLQAAENAGLDAVGMQPKQVSTAKFKGTIIEIVPFKLKPKA